VQVFLYPEELDAVPPDALVEQILELGFDAASVALVYHRARRVLPRQTRISALTRTTTYFEPDPRFYGEIVPIGNGPPALREPLLAFREACRRGGLRFHAWIVALHQDDLAAANPAAASLLLDGSVSGLGLCPSAPATRDFAAGLVSDVCDRFQPDLVELEASFYPAWEPSYNLTLALEPLSLPAQLLGAQCFCGACRVAIGNAAGLEETAKAMAGPPFGPAGAWDESAAAALGTARATGAARLVAAAAAAAHAQGSLLSMFASGPVEQASLQGVSSAAVASADHVLIGCGRLVGDELIDRFRSLRRLVDGRSATASTNWTHERTSSDLARDATRLAEAGACGLALYNLSLLPEAGLHAFRTAAAAFRASMPAVAS
jgi:hypothetical protein